MPAKVNIFSSVGRSGDNLFGDVTIIQQLINLKISKRPIDVDGLCGPATISAISEIQRRHLFMNQPTGMVEPKDLTLDFLARGIGPEALGIDALDGRQIAWGAKVSAAFKAELIEIAGRIEVDPNYLISAIAFETGETFSASIRNRNGATGLIQFMPGTAIELGTTTDDLAAMTAEEQLNYVEKYFNPYKNRLETIEDVYMAILWPAAIGKANSWVLFSNPSAHYNRNSGLDTNQDGVVTKEEAAAMVKARLLKGRGAGYFG